jgi:hypothetical protein
VTTKQEVWIAFVNEFCLDLIGVDFKTQQKKYYGFSGIDVMTQEEITGTSSYAGFSDGYCGNSNKYSGAHGNIKPNEVEISDTDLFAIRTHRFMEQINNAEGIETLLPLEDPKTAEEYNHHYEMGRNTRPTNNF